jgi:hypothetical protein
MAAANAVRTAAISPRLALICRRAKGRLPFSFTIDRQGLLAEDGWKEKQPVWTHERLDQLVTPLLASA